MKIESNFYIPYHQQLIRESLDYAYKNTIVTFDIIKDRSRAAIVGRKDLKVEDIRYIFDLLCGEGYLKPDKFGVYDSYEITDKGRIFYLVTFW
jgi:predicted transcriptional regulator